MSDGSPSPAPSPADEPTSTDASAPSADSLRIERAFAYALIACGSLVCALKLIPGTPPLRPPTEDTLARLSREWAAGDHRALAAAGVILCLAAIASTIFFGPRWWRALRERLAQPAPSVPGLGMGVFLIGFGGAFLATAVTAGALLGPQEGALTLNEQRHVVPRTGVCLVQSGTRLALVPGAPGEAALLQQAAAEGWLAESQLAPLRPQLGERPLLDRLRTLAGVEGEQAYEAALAEARVQTLVHARLSGLELRLSAGEHPARPLWLSRSVAAPTSESATSLKAGKEGVLGDGDALYAGAVGLAVETPRLEPRLRAAFWGGLLGVGVVVALLAMIGGTDPRGSPGDTLRGAGVTLADAPREIGRGLLGYLALLPVLWLALQATSLLAGLLGIPAAHHDYIRALERDPALATWIVLQAGFMAPISEELIFRGLGYSGLRQALGEGRGLLAQALLFAAVHAGFSHLLPMLVLGFGFGALRLTSPKGSLVASITAHMAHNGLTLAFVLYVLT